MKRSRLSFYVNLAIVLMVVTNFFLLAKILDNSKNDTEGEEILNSYREIYPSKIFTEGNTGRSAHFIRVEIDTFAGFTQLAFAICPPSATPPTADGAANVNPTPGLSTPEALLEASQKFSVDGQTCSYRRLIEVGIEAKKYLRRLFFNPEQFRVFTRWDAMDDQHYIAFILVKEEDENGVISERYLHEILLEKGLAYPIEMSESGPLGETPKELYKQAMAAHQRAKTARAGAFQHELDNQFFEAPRTRQLTINEDALEGQTGFNESLPEYMAERELEKLAKRLEDRRADLAQEEQKMENLLTEIDRNPDAAYLREELEQSMETVEILEGKIEEILSEQKRRRSERDEAEAEARAPEAGPEAQEPTDALPEANSNSESSDSEPDIDGTSLMSLENQ